MKLKKNKKLLALALVVGAGGYIYYIQREKPSGFAGGMPSAQVPEVVKVLPSANPSANYGPDEYTYEKSTATGDSLLGDRGVISWLTDTLTGAWDSITGNTGQTNQTVTNTPTTPSVGRTYSDTPGITIDEQPFVVRTDWATQRQKTNQTIADLVSNATTKNPTVNRGAKVPFLQPDTSNNLSAYEDPQLTTGGHDTSFSPSRTEWKPIYNSQVTGGRSINLIGLYEEEEKKKQAKVPYNSGYQSIEPSQIYVDIL